MSTICGLLKKPPPEPQVYPNAIGPRSGGPAKVSMSARAKARAKRTSDGDPVHSLRTLIDDLATITRNTVAPRLPGTEPFQVTTRPTPLQRKAFKLLGVQP